MDYVEVKFAFVFNIFMSSMFVNLKVKALNGFVQLQNTKHDDIKF